VDVAVITGAASMAEPLKNSFGAEIPKIIAGMIAAVCPSFPAKSFVKDALHGYEELELMPRGRKIAQALRNALPQDYAVAIEIVIAVMDVEPAVGARQPMTSFLYLPFSFFIADYGVDHLEPSMRAQYRLTQLFTAEFSMRPFLQKHPRAVLKLFVQWARDPNHHVRRLVSESTRPRLPWAPRLREFQRDPAPVLKLLELLKDDPELYVRRSVANNLNDIGKDHPEILFETARRWQRGASAEREWIIRHALRSAVKRGEAGALAALGFGEKAQVEIRNASISPTSAAIGTAVVIGFEVHNKSKQTQRVLVDFRIHYVKASGASSPKVFKLKTVELGPRQSIVLSKKISLQEMTTRKHYAGIHHVDAMLNGTPVALGQFNLR
jgi:3-methyladenine DNA glycosylase AlkC